MGDQKRSAGDFLQVLASCYFWTSLFTVSALLFPVSLFLWITTVLPDRQRRILHRFTCAWSDLILYINPYWKVQIEGRNKIDPAQVYVMVSNHMSGLDIIVLFQLHNHFKWVAKKGLFIVPFIGWNMALNGYISIERGRGRSKLRMMDKAADSIRKGNSVILFPEGTRSPDGKLQTYKTGAFRLALETRTPILPLVIKGTNLALKKGGLRVNKNRNMQLTILDPIPFESFKHMDSRELSLFIHEKTKQEITPGT
jgi:1-acyl-sn-glycerol-3-phosphate acyltransferase